MAVKGFIEELNETGIHGWALDTKEGADPIQLHIYVDGSLSQTVTCDRPRPDLRSINVPHIQAGFSAAIPSSCLDARVHTITFTNDADEAVNLSLIDSPPCPSHTFFLAGAQAVLGRHVGFIENTANGHVEGWLIDRQSDEPVRALLFVDNLFACEVVCDRERLDVAAAGESRSEVGFSVKLPARCYDGREHSVSFTNADGTEILGFHVPEKRDLQTAFLTTLPRYVCVGRVDGLHNGAVKGWCLVVDRLLDEKLTACEVIVRLGGQIIGQVTANQARPDVAAAFDSDVRCGFSYVPPAELAIGRTLRLNFLIATFGLELPGSPIEIDFLRQHSYGVLTDLLSEVESLFTRTWQIRNIIKQLIPTDYYNLETYHFWAQKYYADLADRVATQSNGTQKAQPLVSVICPVFRPRIKDFTAAVESVISQTYANWELLIVDDASGSDQLTEVCQQFSSKDSRIVYKPLAQNAGISGASNIALEHARGDFILLFDHDDLLVPQAIHVMIQYQAQTGAKMLYSDEDKIDDDGILSEVHLKPDWNYRLLLSQNYVCHLLLVEFDHLKQAGFFRSAYDGAQDHELILRLSESLSRDQIVHVPEILYHWRKTPSSTAASGETKAYAVAAGARAIEDHLSRAGRPAVVQALRKATIYQVQWQFEDSPSVSVIIPYREQIPVTRQCVESLLAKTDYENFNVILADNWSDSEEAIRFRKEFALDSRVEYIRIPERFNYSRINNLAVKQSTSEFLLFLNNDVFTIQSDWLRLMVNEMLANPEVAIVGIKLLYPNGLVQHGGVVLGVGGIADHAHRMLNADDPGYMARAICAQEATAVTAACLLCRRSVFDDIGGFDEKDLQVAYNDVDLCLRVGSAGHRLVWLPNVVAEHHESLSRGSDLVPSQQVRFFHEHETMISRWKTVIDRDPQYSRHFSRQSGLYQNLKTFE